MKRTLAVSTPHPRDTHTHIHPQISQSVKDRRSASTWWWIERNTLNFIIMMITRGCNSHSTHLTLQLGLARLAWARHTDKYAFLLSSLRRLENRFMCARLWSWRVSVWFYQRTVCLCCEIYSIKYLADKIQRFDNIKQWFPISVSLHIRIVEKLNTSVRNEW